jgi:hypothetical protein
MSPHPLLIPAIEHFEKIKSNGRVISTTTNCWRVFQFLFESWQKDPTKPFDAKDITKALDFKNADDVRACVHSIRGKLRSYEQRNYDAVEFTITERTYRLDVQLKAKRPLESVPLVFRNRSFHHDFVKAFFQDESDDLLCMWISGDNVITRVKPWFDSGLIKPRSMRLLLWRSTQLQSAASVAYHIGEDEYQFTAGLEKGYTGWESVRKKFPTKLAIRYYTFMPTMICFASAQRIVVELLPFNNPAGQQVGDEVNRPALLLDPVTTPLAFALFQNVLEDVWTHVETARPQS